MKKSSNTNLVKLAERQKRLLDSSSPLLEYERNNQKFKISCKCTRNDKLPKYTDWAYNLVEQNVRHMYEACSWGWKPSDKLKEINADWSRYVIAFKNDEPIAFAMFRFDKEGGIPVVYCYEMHVKKPHQGQGLGKHLMIILEKIAEDQKMTKVMLTVFKHNKEAREFYKKLGYTKDETSPNEEDKDPYLILSKNVTKKNESLSNKNVSN